MSTTTLKAPKTPTYCYHDLNEIEESKLLSPERFAEVKAKLNSLVDFAYTKEGRKIESSRVADQGGVLMLYPRMTSDADQSYLERNVLMHILTTEEVELVNRHVMDGIREARDQKRFEKAEKISWSDWGGGVWWGDDFFPNLDEALDKIVCDHCEGDDYPKYLWAASSRRVIDSLDVDDVAGHFIDDRGWEDMSTDDLEGTTKLQLALNEFVEANRGVLSYEVDHSKAITLDTVSWPKEIEERT